MQTTCTTCWWRTKGARCFRSGFRELAGTADRRRVAGGKGFIERLIQQLVHVLLVGMLGHVGLGVGAGRNHRPAGVVRGAQGRGHQLCRNAPAADRRRHFGVRDRHDAAVERVVEMGMAPIHVGYELMRGLLMADDAHGLLPCSEDARDAALPSVWGRRAGVGRSGAGLAAAPPASGPPPGAVSPPGPVPPARSVLPALCVVPPAHAGGPLPDAEGPLPDGGTRHAPRSRGFREIPRRRPRKRHRAAQSLQWADVPYWRWRAAPGCRARPAPVGVAPVWPPDGAPAPPPVRPRSPALERPRCRRYN